jgi:DNA uptake protein ComE-like DNA-binding protein
VHIRRKLTSFLIIPIFALVVGLVGCSDPSPAPTGAASPTTAGATATQPVLSSKDSPTAVAASTASMASPEATTVAAGDGTCAKLNLNEATGEQFTAAIPNFSSRMVREFLEYRPYVSIQQFRREIGKYVEASQVAEYEKYVYVPIDPNASDAETLKQLPGVDDALAATIISSRPYTTGEAFAQVLATQLDAQQLTQLHCYLVAQP